MTGPTWPDLLTICVTGQDIACGEPRTCAACPVALAARRLLGAAVDVGYTRIAAYVQAPGDFAPAAEWSLPAIARDFIAGFDRGDPVAPFWFVAERVA